MILTKQQAAEMCFRPIEMPEHIKAKCIEKFCTLAQEKFVREFRRSTYLNLCSFAPDKFIIKYN